MNAQLRLLLAGDSRGRLLGFGGMAIAAFLIGFVLVPPSMIERLIMRGGYYYILAMFVAFILYALRVIRPHRDDIVRWLRRPGWIGAAVLGGTAFALWSDSFAHKVLFDEYVLQGTAWHMHVTKEVATPNRAYDFAGTWLATDAFLDKRPYFFTFLLSLLHDLTGFRVQNVYFLNSALAALALGLVAWLVHALTRRKAAAALGVVLLATLPVFGQNATGASMELHNLAMIAVVMVCAVVYLREPTPDRLALLIFGSVLLAQCRYESVIFVLPVAVVIGLGWWRSKRVQLPWPALIAPLLLVPYAWHDRYVGSTPVLWQLREGESARFGWQYIAGNLEGARNFFFSVSPGQASSLALTLLGLGGIVWVVICYVQQWRVRESAIRQYGVDRESMPGTAKTSPTSREERNGSHALGPPVSPAVVVVGTFAVAVAANLALLMFYYWSRLDEPIAARFALPLYLILTLLAGWLVHSLECKRVPGVQIGTAIFMGWMLMVGAPAYARRLYTENNLVMHELDWELDYITARKHPLLVITSKATMPFLLNRVPAITMTAARARGIQIQWHLQQGTFHEVVVAQVLRPTSAAGDLGVDPEDELPQNFRLEPITRKRFGGRWIQLSRLVRVDPAAVVTVTGQ